MKKFYNVTLLLILFVFISTYFPNNFNLNEKNKDKLFKIKNIKIINNLLISKNLITERLNKIYDKNIFLITRQSIEKPLQNIDFFEKVEIKIKYPNTIIVKIFETRPVAILFKNKNKYLLDSSSNLILFIDKENYNELPTIFGDGAETEFNYFFSLLSKDNFPINQIKNFYYFQIGRWDLQLLNDVIIKFPSNNENIAIKKSIELLNREDFKKYNTIDLRLDDKIIVE